MPRIIDTNFSLEATTDAQFLATVPALVGGIDVSGNPVVVNPNTGISDALTRDLSSVGTSRYAQDFSFYITTSEVNCVIYVNGENTFKTTPNQIILNLSDVVSNSNKYVITVGKQGFVSNERYEVEAVLTRRYNQDTGNSVANLSGGVTTYTRYNLDGTLNIDRVSDSVRTSEPIYTTSPVYTLRVTKYEDGNVVDFDYNVDSQIRELTFNNFQAESRDIRIQPEPILYGVSFLLNGADQSVVYEIGEGQPTPISSGTSSITIVDGLELTIASTNLSQYRITRIIVTGAVQRDITPEEADGSVSLTLPINGAVAIEINTQQVINTISNKPVITTNIVDTKYNINSNTGFPIPIGVTGTLDRITAYIGNSEVVFNNLFEGTNTDNTLIIIPHKYISNIGNYKITLVPSNQFGDGQPIDVLINVVDEFYVGTPDIRNITYPKTIIGPDYVGTNVDFEISWESINADYVKIGKVNGTSTLQAPATGRVKLNVSELLKLDGTPIEEVNGVIQLNLKLTPYSESGNKKIAGKDELVTIQFQKGNLTIPKSVAINRISDAFLAQLDDSIFEDENSKYLTHLLHIGSGDNKVITTWVGDGESLILKLYEPLSTAIQPNQQVWISKIQANPIVETITISGEGDKYCPPLKGPNFSLEPDNGIGYKIFDELIASGSTTSTNLANRYLSTNGINTTELNIQYVSGSEFVWENFSHFGSAEERVNNFYYKVQLIETYQSKYNTLISSSASGSYYLIKEKETLQNNIAGVVNNFDGFENFLYTDVSSLSYPKSAGIPVNSTSTTAVGWYDSVVSEAAEYDKNNVNYLVNNMPEFIREDYDNAQFLMFLDMVGQHFDVIWTYINAIGRTKIVDENKEIGVPDKLVWHLLKSFGWDGKRAFDSQFLWEYAFGQYKDGTQKYSIPLYEANNQIWRRIINNLPYLVKHKGTARAMKAIMACYGVPQSMLTIMEFGGPQDPTKGGTTKFTFEDRTAALHLLDTAVIRVPWKITSTGYHPEAIEFRVKPDVIKDTRIVSASGFSLDIVQQTGSYATLEINLGAGDSPYFEVTSSGNEYVSSITASSFSYDYSSSFFPPTITTSVYSGVIGEYALGPETVTGSLEFPFSTNEYSQILINKHDLGGQAAWFEILLATPEKDRIKTYVSMSILTNAGDWVSGSEVLIGNNFDGMIDEVRLWTKPLQVSKFKNHTLFPDAINGNSVSSSTEDLIFRLDFEYPKDRTNDPLIKNVAINTTYGENFATASNLYSASVYPYQYESYERVVTADVPSLGLSYANKIRFEDTELIGELSHRVRATKKSFDRAPIDSSRLGLFFSPIKELNMDILKAFGEFNIDNYIGDPSDEYKDTYKELENLRSYYFERLDRNLNEYIQLVKYIDKSLFDVLADLAPARAKISKGLLIEPHYLERSKTKWDRPTAEQNNYDTSINTQDNVQLESEYKVYNSELNIDNEVELLVDVPNYETEVNTEDITILDGTYPTYGTTIDIGDETVLEASAPFYEVQIDVPTGATLSGEADAFNFQAIGMEKDSLVNAGFGLYAIGGVGIVKSYDIFGNVTQSRQNVYLVKEQYSKNISTQVAGWPTNGAQPGDQIVYQNVPTTFNKFKVSLLPFSGSITVGNEIVEVKPLNGYFPSHYRYTNNLGEGMIRSFWKGSKQTQTSTPDGLPPVETFTTNPNILRVAKTGRGSGEPILEVD